MLSHRNLLSGLLTLTILSLFPALVLAVVNCPATNLELGQLTGSLSKPVGQITWTYTGGYTVKFKCGAGDNATNCKLCIQDTFYKYNPVSGLWVVDPPVVYATSGNGSSCAQNTVYQEARQVIWSGLPRNIGGALPNFYKITVEIAPYDGSCPNELYVLLTMDRFQIDPE